MTTNKSISMSLKNIEPSSRSPIHFKGECKIMMGQTMPLSGNEIPKNQS